MSENGKGLLEMPVLPQSVIDFRRRQVEALAGKVAKDFFDEHGREPLMTVDYLVNVVATSAVRQSLYPNGYEHGALFETNGHSETIT